MNKTQVKKLLVEERKSMRAKAKKNGFMRKSASIFRGQVKRAEKLGATLPYDLGTFRMWMLYAGWDGFCPFSEERLTHRNIAVDHKIPIARGGEWTLENLELCSQSSNWQKGKMTDLEFSALLGFLDKLPEEIAADVKRRLSTGGKWLARKF